MSSVTLQLFNQAAKLIDLPVLLEQLQCPREILEFPAIGFNRLKSKLKAMGVYHG